MAGEFVQTIKLKVDDSDLVAAVKRFRDALGESGNVSVRPTAGLEKGMKAVGKEADEAARKVEKVGKDLGEAGAKAGRAATEAKKISWATKEAAKETNGLSAAFGNLKGAVTGLVAAYAGFKGISALVGFGKGSIDAFVTQRKQEQMLDTVLRNNGMGNASKFIKLRASQIQKRTTIGDEAMLAGAAELSTFVKDPRRLSRMMNLLADYSMGMTGGAEMNPQMLANLATGLGKAFDGTYDSLRKKGFDTSELEMITNALKLNEDLKKGNVKTDKKTGELKLSADDKELLKWLKEHRGQNIEDLKVAALEKAMADWKGLADEFAKTDEGKIQQLKNDIGDMREEIGRELLPVVGELAKSMKENLPTLKKMFEGFKDVLVSLMETVKAHTGEIREFASAFSDALKLFSKAPVEIMGFVAAMKLLGPAMRSARAFALDSGAGFVMLGKTLKSIGQGGLVAGAIWGLEEIYKAAKAGIEYFQHKYREYERTTGKSNFDEAMRHVNSQTELQNGLGLSEKEKAEVLSRMSGVNPNINLQNVRSPAVATLFGGLTENQKKWMAYEFEKRKYKSEALGHMNAMNKAAQLPKPDFSEEDEQLKQFNAERAKMTKGDTYNNTITVYNSISADSEMTAKIIKDQLRFFATSQLNFTSRTAAAKAFSL